MKPEYREKVLQAITSRMPVGGAACPMCGNKQWSLLDGFVMFSTQNNPTVDNLVIGGPTAPSVGLICTKCGNTQFLNLLVLGLRDMVDRAGAEAAESPLWRAQRDREAEQKRK